MKLSDVSQTAIYTLLCRAINSESGRSVLSDSMSIYSLERLLATIHESDKKRILQWKRTIKGFGASDAKSVSKRAHIIDQLVNKYIADNPKCTIINLACGFDTRYWRINHDGCRYIELDLPEVIEQKTALLGDHICYEQIGRSILDTSWIDEVTQDGNQNFLLVAEGLFMYLPKEKASALLQEISERFEQSGFVLDMASYFFTKGLMPKLISWQFRFFMGIRVKWVFGLKRAKDFLSYGSGYQYIGNHGFKGWYIIEASINK